MSLFHRVQPTFAITVRRAEFRLGHPQKEIEAAKRANWQLKPPLTIMAMIDTGASVTVINNEVAVTFVCSDPVRRPPVERLRSFACGRSSLPRQEGIACLLGRDVLERWALFYDGTNGELWVED
jgi:hypothetical protein